MNRPTPEHPAHPIGFDDPRISEWIDGRLSGGEAEFVARAVAASPELTRFVADLRLLKTAVADVRAAPPPPGFVRGVMEAVVGDAPVGRDDDPVVEAEWRKIEAERIAEEIAEARDEVAPEQREQRRPRWTWLALLGSLAAGVLVAAGLNILMRRGGREVAMAPQIEQQIEQQIEPPQLERRVAPVVADPPVTDELVVIVDGPRGRATLARILEQTGTGEAAAALEHDRIELAAAPSSIEALKAALAGLSNGGIRLPAAADHAVAAARAAPPTASDLIEAAPLGAELADGKQEQAVRGAGRPQEAMQRLVIRVVAAEEPAADATLEPAGGPPE